MSHVRPYRSDRAKNCNNMLTTAVLTTVKNSHNTSSGVTNQRAMNHSPCRHMRKDGSNLFFTSLDFLKHADIITKDYVAKESKLTT